jgi:hypothetical protein
MASSDAVSEAYIAPIPTNIPSTYVANDSDDEENCRTIALG